MANLSRRTKDILWGSAKVIAGAGAVMLASGVNGDRKKFERSGYAMAGRARTQGDTDAASFYTHSTRTAGSHMNRQAWTSGALGGGLLVSGMMDLSRAYRNNYKPEETETVKTNVKPPRQDPQGETVVNPE